LGDYPLSPRNDRLWKSGLWGNHPDHPDHADGQGGQQMVISMVSKVFQLTSDPPSADTPWVVNGPDAQRAAAEQRAKALGEMIREIGVAGSLRYIAAALTERSVPTPKGGRWHSTSVGRLLEHAKIKPLGQSRSPGLAVGHTSSKRQRMARPATSAKITCHIHQDSVSNRHVVICALVS
jgi:hypothetical protein